MRIRIEKHLATVQRPANLRINDQIRRFREICRRNGCLRPYHHFAFGQSPFPAPPAVVEALRRHADQRDYLPTAGLPALREAVAEFYRTTFGIERSPGDVVVGPGSKELLAILLAILDGPVIIPTPAWVSYLPQARILQKEVVPLRLQSQDGFRLTPSSLEDVLSRLSAAQKILILNHPNNPTGITYTRTELDALAEVCRRHGVIVIADEIYALTAFNGDGFASMGAAYPEGTVVTGGLSKDRSCGGWRLGVGILPQGSEDLMENLLKVAGSTYSCVAAPIQHAALIAYSDHPGVSDHMEACRRVNAAVGRVATDLFARLPEVETSTPEGGFYVFVDFSAYRERLEAIGLDSCAAFTEHLLQVEHAAILPAEALLLPSKEFAARCSFVDYDGAVALERWREAPPVSPKEEAAFVRANCPLVEDGVAAIDRYLGQLRRGERPLHYDSRIPGGER